MIPKLTTIFDLKIKNIYHITMIKYESKNLSNARNLRRNMTPQEGKLWHLFLKNYDIIFYKQRLVGSYIIDFYCPKARLAIELDGSQHRIGDNIDYDLVRTQYLNSIDIKVIRYSNIDIDKNLEGVVIDIKQIVEQRIKEIR